PVAQQYQTQPQQQPVAAHTPKLPEGSPPLGLEGFCPVSLVERQAWSAGDVRFGAIHRGRTYLFAGYEMQQRFLANPDQYSPVMAGNDAVLAIDSRQLVQGRREFGMFVDQRIYLFSSEATLRQFEANP